MISYLHSELAIELVLACQQLFFHHLLLVTNQHWQIRLDRASVFLASPIKGIHFHVVNVLQSFVVIEPVVSHPALVVAGGSTHFHSMTGRLNGREDRGRSDISPERVLSRDIGGSSSLRGLLKNSFFRLFYSIGHFLHHRARPIFESLVSACFLVGLSPLHLFQCFRGDSIRQEVSQVLVVNNLTNVRASLFNQVRLDTVRVARVLSHKLGDVSILGLNSLSN